MDATIDTNMINDANVTMFKNIATSVHSNIMSSPILHTSPIMLKIANLLIRLVDANSTKDMIPIIDEWDALCNDMLEADDNSMGISPAKILLTSISNLKTILMVDIFKDVNIPTEVTKEVNIPTEVTKGVNTHIISITRYEVAKSHDIAGVVSSKLLPKYKHLQDILVDRVIYDVFDTLDDVYTYNLEELSKEYNNGKESSITRLITYALYLKDMSNKDMWYINVLNEVRTDLYTRILDIMNNDDYKLVDICTDIPNYSTYYTEACSITKRIIKLKEDCDMFTSISNKILLNKSKYDIFKESLTPLIHKVI